jgi:dihydrofolate reductase
MAKLRVHNLSVSLDGYAAGPSQSLEQPLGVRGQELHAWAFKTRTGQKMILGKDGGETGIDDEFMVDGDEGIGAHIIGRNMFSPHRGPWTDEEWKGWWGDNPPYHHQVFVLTHHLRPSLEMEGGTTFHFVDDPIEAVLERAFDAAGGQDVRIGGGASTIRQYLQAGLIDEMHVAVAPVILGGGERLLDGEVLSGYECVDYKSSPAVAHYRIARKA